MDAKMMDMNSKKYGNLRLERGTLYAQRPRGAQVATDWRLDREMASAFAAIHGQDGAVPSRGIYDIREGYQHPWRTLARRIREARAKNAPKEQVIGVLRVFEVWIDELYRESGRAA